MPVRLAWLSAFAVILAQPVIASERPLEEELPPDRRACWERVYDAAHLKAHPQQKVTAIRLLHQPDSDYFGVELNFNLRKRTSAQEFDYSLFGFCKEKSGGLACTPEWDAGTWRIERGPEGTLLVRNGRLIVNPIPYDAEEVAPGAVKIDAEPDDQAWRLSRIPEDTCR